MSEGNTGTDSLDYFLSALTDELPKTSEGTALKPKEVNSKNEDEQFLGKITDFEQRVLKQGKSKLPKRTLSLSDEIGDNTKISHIHSGDTDSSDDEQNRDYENVKYNDFGKSVKHLLEDVPSSSSDERQHVSSVSWKASNLQQLQTVSKKPAIPSDVYTDPVFGIRIVKPLISSTVLQERMVGRDAVFMTMIKKYTEKKSFDNDWVIAGAVVHKYSKTSQKGNPFSIWTISDLHNDLKTVSLFLFGSAQKELWKTVQGTVIGILNPSVLDKKDGSKDEACLSVDNSQKVMIFGHSKDLGTCRSQKKNGEQCTAFVNMNRCEYCIYHVKQEYQKCSKRSELQSGFAGRGLTDLRNKVLGKNEVFYGGKSFTSIPAAKSKKLGTKDEGLLKALSANGVKMSSPLAAKTKNVKRGAATAVELSRNQRIKDLELLKKLGGKTDNSEIDANQLDYVAKLSSEVTLEESKNAAIDVIKKLKAKSLHQSQTPPSSLEPLKSPAPTKNKICENNSPHTSLNSNPAVNKIAYDVPLLSGNKTVDLSSPISKKLIDRAKLNACKWVQRNGPIKKVNPMNTRGTGKKRALDSIETAEQDSKKQKIVTNEFYSDRFKKMMAATSSHADLLEQHDNDEAEKYFDKLERKEKMEEKMMTTFKVECKAVRCLECKYISFSASDRCKAEKHPLKVYDAVKRFFKCGGCGNRTVTLDIVPMEACINCGSGKWERASMMKDKTVASTHNLSIRGGEQKFVHSVLNDANLNLMVPDE